MAYFSTYTFLKAAEDKKALAVTEISRLAYMFFCGDHWQGGEGWTGPKPSNSPNYTRIMAEIARGFVSKNVIKEVVERHMVGIVGKEPKWYVAPKRKIPIGEQPNPEESQQIDLAESILTDWWDDRGILGMVQKAVSNMLMGGRGGIRVFIPEGKLFVDGEGNVALKQVDIESVLPAYLYIESPNPADAGLITNLSTMEQASLYVWRVPESKTEQYEMSFIDDDGFTVIRSYGYGGDTDQVLGEAKLPLNRKLVFHEEIRDPLITPQILENQRNINKTMTMMGRNADVAGFMERVITGGQPPGDWIDDPDNPGERKFIPSGSLTIGPGHTTFVDPRMYKDINGQDVPMDVNINYRNPVGPETFVATKADYYRTVLEDVGQMHALISGDATVSAVSRVQARSDFLDTLLITKPRADRLIRILLDTALAYAAYLSGNTNQFNLVKAVSDLTPNPGPLTPEEKKAIQDMVDKGQMSRQRAMMLNGIDDVDAERALITQEDEDVSWDRRKEMMETLSKVGYTLTDEQQAWWDKALDIEVRDLDAIAADKAMQQQMQVEAHRASLALTDPNDTTADG